MRLGNRENIALIFESDAAITYLMMSTLAMPWNSNQEAELSCKNCLIAAGTFDLAILYLSLF